MKKYVSYILIIFILLIGLLGAGDKVNAAEPCTGLNEPSGCIITQDTLGTCRVPIVLPNGKDAFDLYRITKTTCDNEYKNNVGWIASSLEQFNRAQAVETQRRANQADTPGTKSEFENNINSKLCVFAHPLSGGTLGGCIVQTFYLLLYALPAWLLAQTAYFFNVMMSVTLNSDLFKHNFVFDAWAVVRDLSNIFFILILLYIAIQLILNVVGHGTKQMIGKVVIIALLINFSMFFTQIIIDSSNIIALVFYNKLDVNTTVNGQKREYVSVGGEKDIAGGMVAAFDPTTTLKAPFFEEAKKVYVNGVRQADAEEVPASTLVAMILIAGLIMCFAIYALFVSGLSFVGRLIELWILIIFSPFAFMSSTVPKLSGMEYLGWGAWFKRLINTAFMAPIFMFFLYFIFMLIKGDIFDTIIKPATGTNDAAGIMKILLGVVLPTMLILILLLKATEFAKKGAGKFGEMVMSGAKMVGGLALGAATGGAALLGTGLIGGGINKFSGAYGETLKEKAKEKGIGGFAARKALKAIDYGTKASFDIRSTGAGKSLAKFSGMNLSSVSAIGLGPKEGGFKGAAERYNKELHEESELYKTGMTDKEVEKWSQAKLDKYEVDKNEAKRKAKEKLGGNFNSVSEKEFEEKYELEHPKPKAPKTADELNKARMHAFEENLGQSGVLGTVAYLATQLPGDLVDDKEKDKDGKKNNKYYKESREYQNWAKEKEKAKEKAKKDNIEFDETRYNRMHEAPTIKSINDGRIKKAKMFIGGAAALATGGYAGGLIGAAGYGAVAGSGFAGASSMIESAGEGKFIAAHEKEAATMKKVTDRIEAITKALGKHEETLTKESGLVSGSKEIGFTLNEERFRQEIADKTVEEQSLRDKLSALSRGNAGLADSAQIKAIKEKISLSTNAVEKYELGEELKKLTSETGSESQKQEAEVKKDLARAIAEKEKLNDLKTSVNEANKLIQQKYELGKDKSKLKEEAHAPKDASHGGTAAPAAAPAPKPAPVAAPEPDHGPAPAGDHH